MNVLYKDMNEMLPNCYTVNVQVIKSNKIKIEFCMYLIYTVSAVFFLLKMMILSDGAHVFCQDKILQGIMITTWTFLFPFILSHARSSNQTLHLVNESSCSISP